MQIAEAIRNGKALTGKNGILTPIIKSAIETALNGEINSHIENSDIANRKNGKAIKQMQSPSGGFELETPRHRNGTFEPEIVKKKQTMLTDELDQKIQKLFTLVTHCFVKSVFFERMEIPMSRSSWCGTLK